MANQSATAFIGPVTFSGTTNSGLTLNSLTTTQRDALSASNGMIIYNTTTTTVQKYEAGAWADIGSGAGVTSVTGTANRLTASASTGAVTLDISASYVGQSSITTLGTITTGVWSGTAIDHAKLTGIVQADIGGLTTASTPTFAGLSLGTGNLSTVGNISVDGSAARDITVARTTVTTGNSLTVQAGGAVSGGSNTAGGNLILKAGIATGNSSSAIQFAVSGGVGSGTSDSSPNIEAILFTRSTTLPVFAIGVSSNTTTGLPTLQSNVFAITGQSAGGIVAYRHATAANAGNAMTIQASGAVSGGTDLAGGQLILRPGISTGTGRSTITLQGLNPAVSTGTSDNSTYLDRHIVGAFKALTNNSAINLVNFTNASNTVIGSIIRYAVEVFDGTNLQMETGEITVQCANKGGVFSGNTVTQIGSAKQFLGSGTLTMTWAITGANPAVLSLNANSSLTPSTGYPRITYSVENFTQQAIAIQ